MSEHKIDSEITAHNIANFVMKKYAKINDKDLSYRPNNENNDFKYTVNELLDIYKITYYQAYEQLK